MSVSSHSARHSAEAINYLVKGPDVLHACVRLKVLELHPLNHEPGLPCRRRGLHDALSHRSRKGFKTWALFLNWLLNPRESHGVEVATGTLRKRCQQRGVKLSEGDGKSLQHE